MAAAHRDGGTCSGYRVFRLRSPFRNWARLADTRLQTACWMARVAQPARAIPDRLMASCMVLPQISWLAPKARPRATLPAAGMVVTEMKTPDSPPVLAEVRESTPAAPAMTATMNDHLSGK